MRLRTSVAVVALLGSLVMLGPSGASAQRRATVAEYGALVGAMMIEGPIKQWDLIPLTCFHWQFGVSTVNPHYAIVLDWLRDTPRCSKWRSDGTWVLERSPDFGWVIQWNGSDPPPCATIPPRVTRDLYNGLHCMKP